MSSAPSFTRAPAVQPAPSSIVVGMISALQVLRWLA